MSNKWLQYQTNGAIVKPMAPTSAPLMPCVTLGEVHTTRSCRGVTYHRFKLTSPANVDQFMFISLANVDRFKLTSLANVGRFKSTSLANVDRSELTSLANVDRSQRCFAAGRADLDAATHSQLDTAVQIRVIKTILYQRVLNLCHDSTLRFKFVPRCAFTIDLLAGLGGSFADLDAASNRFG